jgi:transcriptional regulator with XRE-family HTH domain
MTFADFENSLSAPLVVFTPTFGQTTTSLGQAYSDHPWVFKSILPRQSTEFRWSFYIDLFAHVDSLSMTGRTLTEKAFLNAFVLGGRGTTAPQRLFLCWPKFRLKQSKRSKLKKPETVAQKLVQDIRKKSGLTLEEIAPLVGVSRRSLQTWRAGGAISARKEQRLRDIADTLESLDQKDAEGLRRLLFDRANHGVRPYDLLAEGQFDAAYSAVTGQAAPDDLVRRRSNASLPPAASLLARVSIRNEGPSGTSGRVDLLRSRRLKR